MRLKNPLAQDVYEFQLYPINSMGLDPLYYRSSWCREGSGASEKNNNVVIISFNPHNKGGTTDITVLQMSKMGL